MKGEMRRVSRLSETNEKALYGFHIILLLYCLLKIMIIVIHYIL